VQEGARVLAVDRDLAAAEETAGLATKEGGECIPFQADVTREATLAATMEEAVRRWAASTSCTTMSASASGAATSRSTS
jgi:NAD(P)-dependent dehydrogenase (short-subunit alcohol dehydrogenase family)